MESLQIVLTAVDKRLADAWRRWCGDLPFVVIHHGSIFDVTCDAVVSPANSYGFMDGGIDRLYTDYFGHSLQTRLQQSIRAYHGGELLVGQAEMVPTEHPRIPYLIAAPTMRVPMTLGRSINPYLAARAVFRLLLNDRFSTRATAGLPIAESVRRVAFPGLGTGAGGISSQVCARQVRSAIEDVVLGKFEFPDSTLQARKRHDRLVEE